MQKKVLSVLLAFAMVFAVINAGAIEARAAVGDLGGRNIRAASWWALGYDTANTKAPDPAESGEYYQTDLKVYQHKMQTAKDHNFTVTDVVFDFGDMVEKIKSSVASGSPAFDIGWVNGDWMLDLILSNCLTPYDDFLPASHDLFTAKAHVRPTARINGKVWGMNFTEDGWLSSSFLGVNLDIIKSIGAKNPAELYDSGAWGWDDFYEIMELAADAGLYGLNCDFHGFVNNMIATNDGLTVAPNMSFGYDDPKTLKALDFITKIFSTDRMWNHLPDEPWNYEHNTSAYLKGDTCFFIIPGSWAVPREASFAFATVPLPIGPDNKSGVSFFIGLEAGYIIPRGVKNPAEAFEAFIQMNRWYGDDLSLVNNIEKNWAVPFFPTLADAKRIGEAAKTQGKFDLGTSIGGDYIYSVGNIAMTALEGEADAANEIAGLKEPLSKMLFSLFGAPSEAADVTSALDVALNPQPAEPEPTPAPVPVPTPAPVVINNSGPFPAGAVGVVDSCYFLNVRKGPGPGNDAFEVLSKGDLITVLEYKNKWILIDSEKAQGWVYSEYITLR